MSILSLVLLHSNGSGELWYFLSRTCFHILIQPAQGEESPFLMYHLRVLGKIAILDSFICAVFFSCYN